MQHSMQFTDADRNEAGRIALPHERTLAELLPAAPEATDSTPAVGADESAPAPRRGRWPDLTLTARQVQTAAGVGLGLGVAIALMLLIGGVSPATPRRRAPVTAPSAPAPAPSPSPRPPSPIPSIATWWAPGRGQAPAIGSTTPYTPTAVYGDWWVRVALPGGGLVWITRGDAEARGPLPDALPDLSPPPTPAPPPRAPAIPAAAPPAPAGCSLPENPSHTSTRQVVKNGVPIGQVTGIGCSQGEADRNADALAAKMLGGK